MSYTTAALLRAVAESQRRHRPRDRAIVYLADAGLAPSEVATLSWDQIQERGLAGAVIHLPHRQLLLGPEAMAALRGYRRRGRGRVVPLTPRGVKGVLDRLRSRLRPRQTRRERLQRIAADLLVEAGISRREVEQLLENHKTPPSRRAPD